MHVKQRVSPQSALHVKFEPECTPRNMRAACIWLTSPTFTMFTCTLGRRQTSKHISSKRGEHSAKFQRITLKLK